MSRKEVAVGMASDASMFWASLSAGPLRRTAAAGAGESGVAAAGCPLLGAFPVSSGTRDCSSRRAAYMASAGRPTAGCSDSVGDKNVLRQLVTGKDIVGVDEWPLASGDRKS